MLEINVGGITGTIRNLGPDDIGLWVLDCDRLDAQLFLRGKTERQRRAEAYALITVIQVVREKPVELLESMVL